MVSYKSGGKGFSNQKPARSKPRNARNFPEHYEKKRNAADLINQGKLEEAETIYRELIHAGTLDYTVYGNLAAICGIQGRRDELILLLKKTLELNPDCADSHNNLGNALREKGDLQAAAASYKKAIQLNGTEVISHINLGNSLLKMGDLPAAITSYKTALQLNPYLPEVYDNLCCALKMADKQMDAIFYYKKSLEYNPEMSITHCRLGNTYREIGDNSAAIKSYNKALQLDPTAVETHINLGITLKSEGNITAAITAYRTALQLQPGNSYAYYNLGNALVEQDKLEAAIECFDKVLRLNPYDIDARINLGNTHQEKGDLSSAITNFKRALEIDANCSEAHWNCSLAMLLDGDYKNGWDKYEFRNNTKTISAPHAFPKCTQWSDEHNHGMSTKLLLITEGGLGDTLQFMRYVTTLRNQGISISFCAQPKLHGLIKASGIDQSPLTPKQAAEINEGNWMSLMSVPRQLEVSPENSINNEPYIKTSDELVSKWKSNLSKEKRPIIGINWQGDPQTEKLGLRGRSLPLECFASITQSDHISLLSLQKGFGCEQLDACSFKHRFVSCQDQINETWDFEETAAIIANCDLVITSDTSVAHLAGGMGKTTWLLLKKVPEWRWGLEGDSTFWYPSMRLFRQKDRGNWGEVLERVAEALQEHFGGNPYRAQAAHSSSFKPKAIKEIFAPISLGELIDKITILQIKTEHLQGSALENVKKELEALETTLRSLQLYVDTTIIQRLKEVNQALWTIEDNIRQKERQKSFDETFIDLARSVYQRNDQRAAIKKEINTSYGSAFVEEKSYHDY